jgi:hypothetical protein
MSAMAITRTLTDDARSTCPYCGAIVWVYPSFRGDPVALDNARGNYVIDGGFKAYRASFPWGYRAHQCSRLAQAPLSAEVADDEFLWL